MIAVEFDDHAIVEALLKLQESGSNLRPALLQIGELLQDSTQQRFSTATAPDGQKWAANTIMTIDRKGSSQPLTDGGTLGNTIDYQLLGSDGLQIGSPMEYAAMMQFGGTQAEFPNLWGDIPARPFLGISDNDRAHILDIIAKHMQN